MIGLIAGSGIYDASIMKEIEKKKVSTEFGEASEEIVIAEFEGKQVAFLPRHGSNHSINPSNVNYRANIQALKKVGVTKVIALNAVGSLQIEMKPGTLVFPDQFIDRTYDRERTFYDGKVKGFEKVCHINVSDPFCKSLREDLIKSAEDLGIQFTSTGTYVCVEGPRFSTRAESELYRTWKAHVIGMTLCPEAVLAREAELCYANISMITDYDNLSEEGASSEEIIKTMKGNIEKVRKLLVKAIPQISDERNCGCGKALEGAFI